MRDFAAQQGVDEQTALQKGMEQKAVGFVKQGGEYLPEGIGSVVRLFLLLLKHLALFSKLAFAVVSNQHAFC